METPRTGRLYSVVGFTIACVLMGAVPAKAQDDCKALEQAQADAWSKLHNTPAHVYSTGKTGNLTVTTELIYAGGSMYMKLNGKWTHAGSITDVDQIAAEAKKNSKDTCTHAKDELINGEMAAVYTTHSETPKGKLDMKIWISKAKGLLLRQDIDSDGGKSVNSARYDYENVKAPL
jgi:outer membrane lipoprotein-sorting protein